MDKKKEKQSVLQLLFGFMDRANGDHVGAYAAQAAYFLIMSFIPFILFLTTIIRYTPLTYNMVSETIRAFVPHNIQNFVLTIVSEVYGRSTAVVPISAIMALWSAGKAMQSLTNGLNSIYHQNVCSCLYISVQNCNYCKSSASGSWKSDSDYGRKVRSIPWENYRKDHWSQNGACICRTVSDLSDFV